MIQEEPIVEILCEWAVSNVRYGEHRAMAVAMLLEKRQAHLTGEGGDCDDKDSISSGNVVQNSLPIFQGLLMKFLDNDAPILGLKKICIMHSYSQHFNSYFYDIKKPRKF